MQILKRDCSVAEFDKNKIYNAIMKAMTAGSGIVKPDIAQEIADEIAIEAQTIPEIDVSSVENMVYIKLVAKGESLTAKAYEGYRSIREYQRNIESPIDKDTEELIDGSNDYWNRENSNKDAVLNTTQRDYMAGIVSKDMCERKFLPPDIVQAHKDGILHFHDADYFAQRMHNCDLVNLEDMLQNGTVISGTMIEKPHMFSTACTIATQVIAQVASNQFGGQTVTLSHLAPFVDISRQKFLAEALDEVGAINSGLTPGVREELAREIAEKRLKAEIAAGVQTIQYQVITLMTTNGQAPFLSVNMYLNEVPDGQIKEDLALIIEEVLRQRIQGVKNEAGVWITPAFPKLLYVLEEDNISPDGKYYYLTELAAECTAKRMVPDYISEKVMLELKGDVYPCIESCA